MPHSSFLFISTAVSTACSRLFSSMPARMKQPLSSASGRSVDVRIPQQLPTYVSARNASTATVTGGESASSQLMSPHGMHPTRSPNVTGAATPNSCLRTECIGGQMLVAQVISRSQLMSPHGMHRRGYWRSTWGDCSQLMSPHGMHPWRTRIRQVTINSQLMSPHGMHLAFFMADLLSILPPNSCLRTECIDTERIGDETFYILPTHVSARNASRFALPREMTADLPTHVSARNASSITGAAGERAAAPNSCLRTECIHFRRWLPHLNRAPNSCLRTECIAPIATSIWVRSPLPTHVSARNASFRADIRVCYRKSPNSCLRTECIVCSAYAVLL